MKPTCYILLLVFIFNVNSFALRNLKKVDIRNMQILYDESILKIPGNKLNFGVAVTLKNGETHYTRGFLGGKLTWNNFIIKVEGGKLIGNRILITEQKCLKENQLIIMIKSRFNSLNTCYEIINLNYEKSIKIIPADSIVKAPGYSIPVNFDIKFDNDYVATINSKTIGNYTLKKLNINSVCGYFKKGALWLSPYPEDFINHEAGINVSVVGDSSVTDTFKIVLDYCADYYLPVYTFDGSSGFSGSDGTSGTSSSSGGDGSDGGDGSNGDDGHTLEVYTDSYFDTILNKTLLKVHIEDISSDNFWKYLVDPLCGTITIKSYGGDGGGGGNGGSGGDGGKGDDGSYYTETVWINDSTSVTETRQNPGSSGGNGGDGGDGGDGGNGGNGGDFYIYYTNMSQIYNGCIKSVSISGNGGSGGSSGNSGSGGSGGSGNPSGTNGTSGSSGSSGSGGCSGNKGSIYYHEIESNQFPH